MNEGESNIDRVEWDIDSDKKKGGERKKEKRTTKSEWKDKGSAERRIGGNSRRDTRKPVKV